MHPAQTNGQRNSSIRGNGNETLRQNFKESFEIKERVGQMFKQLFTRGKKYEKYRIESANRPFCEFSAI